MAPIFPLWHNKNIYSVQMEFAPPARSCHVTKWPEFQGYGFTLHHNKKLDVQEIGGWGQKWTLL